MVSASGLGPHLKSEEAREETILALETTLAAARQSAEAGLNAGAVFGRDVTPLAQALLSLMPGSPSVRQPIEW